MDYEYELKSARSRAEEVIHYFANRYPDFNNRVSEIKDELQAMPIDVSLEAAMERACRVVFSRSAPETGDDVVNDWSENS